MNQKKPRAVLISDIHYNINNLELAEASMASAINFAAVAGIPVYILGDLHDTKAMLRAEVVNALIVRLADAKHNGVNVTILIGNHDLINEKEVDHALEFLEPWVYSINACLTRHPVAKMTFIPYQATPEAFAAALKGVPKDHVIFMHQGVKGADMGEYVMDHSAVDVETLKDYTVFSGHYHKHHTVGTVTYVGTPYTVTAAEANDGPKGFLVLYDDNSFEQVPTNLRKHVTVSRTPATVLDLIPGLKPEDKLWIKVTGPYSELERLDKQAIGAKHLGHVNFKLDKIVTESEQLQEVPERGTPEEPAALLDSIIDASQEPATMKAYLKNTWRSIV